MSRRARAAGMASAKNNHTCPPLPDASPFQGSRQFQAAACLQDGYGIFLPVRILPKSAARKKQVSS